MGEFLKHLAEFNNITDEEIELRSTSEFGGLDAMQALNFHLERMFCQSIVENVIEQLKKL